MNSLVLVALKPRDNRMLLLLFLGAVQTLLSRGWEEWPSASPPLLAASGAPLLISGGIQGLLPGLSFTWGSFHTDKGAME